MQPAGILIVEDDRIIAEAITDIVQSLGHRSDWSPAGPDALLKATETDYDLAILDLELPQMPGIEVAAELKALKPGIRILFTTGTSEQEKHIDDADPQVAGIIYKPFDITDLQSAIEKALG